MAAIHILFGDSAAGNFKAAYNIYTKNAENSEAHGQAFLSNATLLNCIDPFAIGPVFEMDIPSGFFDRINWIGEFLDEALEPDMTYDDVDACLERISDFYKKLSWIEEGQDVVIWHGHNVVEHIGACMVSSLLPNCELYEVDLHELKYQLFEDTTPEQVAACDVLDLAKLFDHIALVSPLKRAFWEKEWQDLVCEKGNLRIWSAGGVHPVKSDYFDEKLVEACGQEPLLASSVIANVLADPHCEAGEKFLNLRLKKMIDKGELGFSGQTDSYKNYSVFIL